MNKKPIYMKYLLSVPTLFLLVNMLIIYLVRDNQDSLKLPLWTIILTSIIWIISCVMMSTYWWIKFSQMKKIDFEFTKRDYKYAMLSAGTYLVELLIGLTFIIATNWMQSVTALFWISLILIILASMVGSVLEMFSRITYQIFLNQKAFMEYEASQGNNSINVSGVDHQNAEIVGSNVRRSKQAEEILKKDSENKKNPFDED